MATATFKLTSYTTVKLTYSIANVSDMYTRLTVTGYTFINTRDSGTTQKVLLDVYGLKASPAESYFDAYYEPSNKTFAIAKGTKSKTGSITRWYQWTRKHSAYTGKVKLVVNMDADGEWWEKSVVVSVSVHAKTSYTVTYNANGGTGAPSAGTKWYGEALTLSAATPTWSGHVFRGWGTSKAATSVAYASGAQYTSNAAATLYAIWTCTVSYNANGGSGAPSAQTKYAYSNINLSTVKPTRAGYDFRGWATSSTGSVAYQPGAAYTASSGAALYAVWAVTPPSVSVKTERAAKDDTTDPPTYTPSLVGSYGLVTVTYSLSSVTQLDAVSCSVGGESAALVSSGGTTMVYASASQYGLSEQPTVEVSVSDAASNVTTKTAHLPTASPPIHFKPGGAGVGIGEPAEWDGFRVAMKPYLGRYPVEDTNDEYALIIGNGTSDAARSNAFAVDWDGGIYVDDHDSPIGTVLETGQVTYSGAMVANTMKQGASLSLTAGTWVLVGLFTFGTASTSGTRNISCDLFQGTVSGTTVCRQRVVSAAANESFLQAIGVVTPTATTSYSIGGSSSVATNQARYSSLTAVRIA